MSDDAGGTTTLQHPILRLSPAHDASYKLRVIEGPDAGRELVIDGTQPSRILVGQSPACDLRLTDPGVSRRHLSVELEASMLRMKDLGSTNGTSVDGVLVIE